MSLCDLSYLRRYHLSSLAGIDEVGRGPLAGPVVAVACVLPPDFTSNEVRDSKSLSPARRHQVYHRLIQDPRISFASGSATHEEIDQLNIYQATYLAMRRAVDALSIRPEFLLIDGPSPPVFHPEIPYEGLVKGDQLSLSIAAASILAKEIRDQMMIEYDAQWPVYGFKSHKGYGSQLHLEMLRKHGPCPIHRRSFAPVRKSLETTI